MRCWFHKWGKWKTIEVRGIWVDRRTGKEIAYTESAQERECAKCGRVLRKTLDK